jgi:nitrate reductase beta subunit
MRAPISYLASLLSGGNQEIVSEVLRKLIALRLFKRAGNIGQPLEDSILKNAGLDEAGANKLYRLFTIAPYRERFIIPAQQREEQDPQQRKGASGFGILNKTRRPK